MDRAVVKLDPLADADGAGAQDHDDGLPAAAEGAGFADLVTGGVEIGRPGVKLGRAGVHHLVGEGRLPGQRVSGELFERPVGVAHAFGKGIVPVRERFPRDAKLEGGERRELLQEEHVDLRDAVDLLRRHAGLQGLEDREEAVIILVQEPILQGAPVGGRGVQRVEGDLGPAHGLHQGHLEVRCDCHHFAGGLHLGAQAAAGVRELVKRPLGELHHDIVQGGLKAGAGLAGDVVQNLIEGVAKGQAGADLGDGIARGLGGQRGGARDAGVDLDNRVLEAVRVQGELAVAAAHDAEGGDDVQGGAAEHLVLPVRQGQCRRHDNGIAGVDADGVEVLHRADGDDIPGAVAHGLKLNLLPAGDALLHQDLGDGREIQPVAGDGGERLRGFGDAAAGAAEGIGRADDDGIADFVSDGERLRDIGGRGGGDHRLAHGGKGLAEALAVLGALDALDVGAEQAHAVARKGAVAAELHGEGEAGLAAETREQAVGALLFNDAAEGHRRQGL